MKINFLFKQLAIGIFLTLFCFSCKKQSDESGKTYHFSKDKVGVCSWSWKTNMTTILTKMESMGIAGMQLATSPWILGDISEQKEVFGPQESKAVLDRISYLSKKGTIKIMSTMISFPKEDYSSRETIKRTSGFMYQDEKGNYSEKEWDSIKVIIRKAASLTDSLDVRYLQTIIGFVEKDRNLAIERVKTACDICSEFNVTLLAETGQSSGSDMKNFFDELKQKYPDINIGINFDPANYLFYETDTPRNAYTVLFPWIRQIHVKDAIEDASKRASWAEDVVWGAGDVSTTYDFLRQVYDSGYTGNILVERQSGNTRAADIEVAMKALVQ